MSAYLPFIFSGLVTGAVYGLAGVGLVLTYKTSGVFNMAHGALATVSAYVFYTLHIEHGTAWPLAAAIAVLVVGPAMGLLFERLARAIGGASLALQVGATVGILLVVQAAVVLIYGTTKTRSVPVFLASGQTTISGVTLQYSDLITFAIAAVATAALYAYFRFTRAGLAMRAVVDDPDLVGMAGTAPTRVRRYAWLIGVVFASLSGVLFTPLLPLDPTVLTFLVVQAFGAAALGAFRSLPMTFVGGLAIGVLASLSTKWFTSGILVGIPPALPFIVLFIVLLVFPRRYLTAKLKVRPLHRPTWVTPAPVQLGGGAVVLAFLAIVPTFAGIHLSDWTNALAMTILFLSLGLLVRTSGQVSLGHVGFAAVGTAAFSHITQGSPHLPWILGLLVAGLIAVPIGALLAIPAIRLTGLYLALATFGSSLLLAYMFYNENFMFGNSGNALTMGRPGFATGETAFYFVVLAIVVIVSVAVVGLERSRLGRLLRGMGDSPTALATSGTAVNVTRVMVFCISAFLAAIAGALSGISQGAVSVDSYQPLLSLTWLALIVIVVGGAPWYALIAAGSLILVPSYITSYNTSNWLQVLFGVFAVLYALTPDSMRGAPPPVRRLLDGIFRRAAPPDGAGGRSRSINAAGSVDRLPVAAGSLEVRDVSVRFGGLIAVDDVSFSAPTGRITGLIGPNGAGKTTTFNTCSGLNRPSAGDVRLDGQSLLRASPSARARTGLGRTFQQMELFESLPVWDNVAIGREGRLAGAQPLRHFLPGRRDALTVRAAAAEALRLCGISDLADTLVRDLSTGQRRLVELARSMAGESRILLLDEPSSGLDVSETAQFGAILRRVVGERGIGILLVEHDMSLVMDVCEYLYVLDFGKLVFEGTPEEVRRSPVVQAAYLGDVEAERAAGSDDDLITTEETV
jgi:ABC-type branched-subunit amino acid transport system ATPase component/branched-subunit amino acid ABC-type transport system permease component